MGKRIIVSIFALVVAGACLILLAHGGPMSSLSLQSPPGGVARAWPADQCWAWTFPLPDRTSGDRISLRLRRKSMPPLPRGATPTIQSFEKAMPHAAADEEFGTAMIVRSPAADGRSGGTVSVQLVDLADVAATPTSPGQSLRVMAKLSVGGSETKLSGETSILPGERFAGRSVRGEGTWSGGELYLMSFWVESDGGQTQYDVLLEQSADRR